MVPCIVNSHCHWRWRGVFCEYSLLHCDPAASSSSSTLTCKGSSPGPGPSIRRTCDGRYTGSAHAPVVTDHSAVPELVILLELETFSQSLLEVSIVVPPVLCRQT